MPYRANYPATVAEILNPRMKFNPIALRAVRALARSKPWRGTTQEKLDKLRVTLIALSAAYNVRCPQLMYNPRGIACYVPAFNLIQLNRFSVVTFLHEFAHVRDFDERQAVRWSVNIFRRCFPASYAACEHVGHMLVRPA